MYNLKVLIIVQLLISSIVLAQRGDRNKIQFEDDTLHPRKSSFLSNVAQELFKRSSSSQILNLNLSNLLLVLVLKAIVYGAGYIGNQAFKGRENIAEDNIFSEEEAALALGYVMGENCLYQAACEVPHTAKEYLGAAELVLQTAKLMPQFIKIDEPFESVILELQKAVDSGLKEKCPLNYSCKEEIIQRFIKPK